MSILSSSSEIRLLYRLEVSNLSKIVSILHYGKPPLKTKHHAIICSSR